MTTLKHVVRIDRKTDICKKSRQVYRSVDSNQSPVCIAGFWRPDNVQEEQQNDLEKERRLQEAVLSIKDKFGRNAVLKGTNFLEGARSRERHNEVGGHKA